MKAINEHKLKMAITLIFVFLLFLLVSGCDRGPESPRGFSLPVGNAEKGEIAFREFKCLECHTLPGTSVQPSPVSQAELSMASIEKPSEDTAEESSTDLKNPGQESGALKEKEISVVLGGDVNRHKTYADLVTSIINPSHRIARNYLRDQNYARTPYEVDGVSKMKVYNDVMTVAQLIDIVTFLQPHYKLIPYRNTDYGIYAYQ